MKYQKNNLTEGLRTSDLKDYVDNIFNIDKFKSKMGEDDDVIVLSFKVKDKYPAIDLMEFVERGYPFILDADMSAGEENDGQYQVFIEILRTPDFPNHLNYLINGIGKLTDCVAWKFQYQKNKKLFDYTTENITQHVPLTKQAYADKLQELKNSDISKFFDKGAIDSVTLESDNSMTFKKPFFGDLSMKFVSIGKYDDVKNTVPGAISLDENSQSQVFFLQKYLGDYDITKIGDQFLIKNGTNAVVVEKNRW